MSLMQFLKARRTALKPAKINFRNIVAVIQSFFRKQQRKLGGFDLKDHIYEQIVWRRHCVILKSPKCWKSGACVVCGCDILGKTMEDRGCSITEHEDMLKRGYTPCYPEMMDEQTWLHYKDLHNIKLFE